MNEERPSKRDSDNETEGRKRLMMLMTRHQRQIFSYIYILVPNRSDAEDLLQETSLVICEKFHEFEEGTDFVAWACQIAYWRIRYSRQKFCAVQGCLRSANSRSRGANRERDGTRVG